MSLPAAEVALLAAGFPGAFLLRCPVLLALDRLMPSWPTVYLEGAVLMSDHRGGNELLESRYPSVFNSPGGDNVYMEVMDASPDDIEGQSSRRKIR